MGDLLFFGSISLSPLLANKKNEKEEVKVKSECQHIEFTDQIECECQRSSRSEEEEEDKSQFFLLRKPYSRVRNKPRQGSEIRMNPIIRDFIINERDNAPTSEFEKQEEASKSWGFQLVDEFFKENNQQKKD